jgi:cholecystokinin A receptor
MLFVVVLEFFICWTPLYVINTIALFDQKIVYQNLGYTAISFFQLLAYTSSCCNPITYCFMNVGFRKAFLNLFRCFKNSHEPTRRVSVSGYGNNALQVTNFITTLPRNNREVTNNNKQGLNGCSSDVSKVSNGEKHSLAVDTIEMDQ